MTQTNFETLFTNLNTQFGAFNADQTGTVPWPPAGDHICTVIDIIEKQVKWEYKTKAGMQLSIPAIEVSFAYRCAEPLPDQEDDKLLEWTGARFTLPLSMEGITEDNRHQQIQITRNRFAGHLCGLHGITEAQLTAIGLDEAHKQAKRIVKEDTAATICKVRVQNREDRQRPNVTYHTDFIVAKESGPSAFTTDEATA